MTIRKNGGIWFVKCGRFGGSFYVKRHPVQVMTEWQHAFYADRWLVRGTVAFVGYALMHAAF